VQWHIWNDGSSLGAIIQRGNWQFCQFSEVASPGKIPSKRLQDNEYYEPPMEISDSIRASDDCGNHRRIAVFFLILLFCPVVWPQVSALKPVAPEAQAEPPKDTLGRNTPRGAVLGFLSAARKNNAQIAALYLNTPLRGAAAEDLARQLAIVLDRRLPARLNELSDNPEGSLPDPLRPDEDIVGTIGTADGDLDILVERVDRGKSVGKVWLFSRETLKSIPDVFQELSAPPMEKFIPEFLIKTRLVTIPLFHWLAFFVGMPVLYGLTGLLNRIISFGFGALRRRFPGYAHLPNLQILPPPIRLLLLALAIRQCLLRVGLSLLARQFWSTTALIIVIAACVWLLILLNGRGERYLVEHRRGMRGSSPSVLRLARRVVDGFVLLAGLLFTLHRFGIDPTAALAGLGVGGIAVALAAQKTLENLIAGISLIADHAVHVGDTLKLGDTVGTVEEVGLRSTRIRTLDRTVVCLPNGQIAAMSLETLSARDKFWFHPVVGLRYETTPVQIRSIMTDVRKLLTQHASLDSSSVRVRFIRLGTFSLDLDIFAYVYARDWNHFLEIQEEMLLSVMDIVQRAGAEIAFPSQTMYIAADSSDKLTHPTRARGAGRDAGALQEHNVHH
jgi:MscS family membrane protein